MAVNLTTYLSLNKPTQDEMAKNWAKLEEWAAENNSLYEAAIPDDSSYTPVLATNGTQPNIGTGANATSFGRYIVLPGNFVMGWFVFRLDDPNIAAGSGDAYAVSLPLDVDTVFHTIAIAFTVVSGSVDVIGEGYIRDNTNSEMSMTCALDICHVSGISYARFNTEAYTGKSSRFLQPATAQPFIIADEDRLGGNFIYKAA